jgi:hypothetical protein
LLSLKANARKLLTEAIHRDIYEDKTIAAGKRGPFIFLDAMQFL